MGDYRRAIAEELRSISVKLDRLIRIGESQVRVASALAERVQLAIGDIPKPQPEPESELWTGQDGKEPPAHVNKIIDVDGDIFERWADGKWAWTRGIKFVKPDPVPRDWSTLYALFIVSPYTEVRDA